VEVALAGAYRRVLHAEFAGKFLDRAPAGVGMLDIGLAVQLEELELVIGQFE
jgi:hypothetical protein